MTSEISPVTHALSEADQDTLQENDEPRPEKSDPIDIEQRAKEKPMPHWSAVEVQEIPHK